MAPRASALALLFLLLLGCPKAEAPKEDERLIRKLKEAAREPPRPPPEVPNEKLAQLAAAEAREGARKLPHKNETVHVGTVALKLAALATTQKAQGEKISVTTDGLFLKVQLWAQNVGDKPQALDLSPVHLSAPGGAKISLAKDAQFAAGTRPLRRSYAVGERLDLTLYFEVPTEALAEGLALVFPAEVGGEEVSIPLQ